MNANDISNFVHKLESVSPVNITVENVEDLVSECSSLFYNAADAAGMVSQKVIRRNANRGNLPSKRIKRMSVRGFVCNTDVLRIIEERLIM